MGRAPLKGTSLERAQELSRRELGAVYTPSNLAAFIVRHTLRPLLRSRLGNPFEFFSTTVCEPTCGGGSFLRAAADEFESYADDIRAAVRALNGGAAQLFHFTFPELGRIDDTSIRTHVAARCLYGVDLDPNAVRETRLALRLHETEGRIKYGNAFVSLFDYDDRATLDPRRAARLVELDRTAPDEAATLRLEIIEPFRRRREREWGFNPEALDPFTWEVEFPEIFFDGAGYPRPRPGFDCILGNPPWENLEKHDDEFFSMHDPTWPRGKNRRKEIEARRDALLEKPRIRRAYARYLDERKRLNAWFGKTSQYRAQSPVFGSLRGAPGKPNLYRLACELFPRLTRSGGAYGFIVPEGFAGDKGSRDLRRALVEEHGLATVLGFNKRNRIFPGALQPFCIVLGNPGHVGGVRYADGFTSVRDLERFDPDTGPCTTERSRTLETYPLIPIRSSAERSLLDKLMSHPSPIEACSPYPLLPHTELNTTTDFRLVAEQGATGWPVWKGEHIGRFRAPGGSPYRLRAKPGLTGKGFVEQAKAPRLGWRLIAGTNDPRRMVAAVIPPESVCFNSINLLTGPRDEEERLFILGILNSFCYEHLIRCQAKNNNINLYLLSVTPILRAHPNSKRIVAAVRSIHGEPEPTRRRRLEAELEAIIAVSYGLDENECAALLDRFDREERPFVDTVRRTFLNLLEEPIRH